MSKSQASNRLPRPSRRAFLKTSTTAIGLAGGLSLRRGAHAAGDDTLKVGLIGCGGRGSGAAVNIMNAGPEVKLVAMADLFEDKVKGSRERLKKIKPDQVQVDDDHCFTDFDGYKSVLASDIDVVLIAAASCFHPQMLTAAIEAGKHVFCEKPHALDVPGIRVAKAAVEAAKKKNLSLVSGLCWRYDPGVRATMEQIAEGAIGDLQSVQELYITSPYCVNKRNPEWNEMQYQMRNWYHFNWTSGDQTAQQLIHSIDKGSWVLGDVPPVSAWGMGGRAATFEPRFGDLFDHHAVVFEYPNGVLMHAYCRDQYGCYNETSDKFVGTKGRCNLLKNRIEGENSWRYKGPKRSMYDAEQKALVDSIRQGKPINNGNYMIVSSMLAILAQMVCYTGRKITWEEAMKSNYQVVPDTISWDMEPPVKPGKDGMYPCPIPGITKLS